MVEKTFHQNLQDKIDRLVHLVYKSTKKFPKEEIYGVVSQLRRAVLSVALNYVEGFARCRDKVQINFLEISYGSLKETKYLLKFSLEEKYLSHVEYSETDGLVNEIGAMLWKTIDLMKKKSKKIINA